MRQIHDLFDIIISDEIITDLNLVMKSLVTHFHDEKLKVIHKFLNLLGVYMLHQNMETMYIYDGVISLGWVPEVIMIIYDDEVEIIQQKIEMEVNWIENDHVRMDIIYLAHMIGEYYSIHGKTPMYMIKNRCQSIYYFHQQGIVHIVSVCLV